MPEPLPSFFFDVFFEDYYFVTELRDELDLPYPFAGCRRRKIPCVYVISTGYPGGGARHDALYVGQTTSPAVRMSQHFNSVVPLGVYGRLLRLYDETGSPQWEDLASAEKTVFFRFCNAGDSKKLERLLIHSLSPLLNVH